ncbi:hypothetical protein J6590_004839 [Homalodisca vitripennis]|nr:hypothetical protein J6590_004839 [Homalodisca vitripennis]
MEWPNELVLDFLQYYENEPVIWNPSHPNHKNRNEIYDAWKRIESKMGNKFSVTELKKKKDSLMASFRTCLKKVKESCKSGAGSDDIYKPNWFAYEIMERFLKDKNLPRETLSSEGIFPLFIKYSANSSLYSFAAVPGFLGTFCRGNIDVISAVSSLHDPPVTIPLSSESKVPAGVYIDQYSVFKNCTITQSSLTATISEHKTILSVNQRHEYNTEVAPPPNEEQFQAERNIDLPNLSDNVPSASREEPEQRNEAIVLPACATTSPNYASSSFKPPPRKKSRTAEEIEIKKKMDAAFTTLQSLQPKKEKHLCDIYGELVAAKLKSMDESTREICMHRIDNVLFEMRMVKGPATSGNTYFMQPSPSSSASVNSSPCPDETLTLYTVPSDSNELHALSGTVVVCSDAENSEHPPNVGLENYFSKFK